MKLSCCPHCNSKYATLSASSKAPTRQPLVLKCGHTFCEACIGQRLRKTESNQYQAQVTCSTCKQVTPLETGIRDLPVNVYLSAYLDINQRAKLDHQLEHGLGQFVPVSGSNKSQKRTERESKDKKCKMCLVKDGTYKCIECDSILCLGCFEKVHSISAAIKQHKPIPIAVPKIDSAVVEGVIKCTEHDRLVEYFCEDDLSSICSRCFIMGSHKNHTIISFEEKNKKVLGDIENEMPVVNRVVQNLKMLDKKMAAAMPDMKTETKSIIEDINQSFLEIHALLQAREMEMINSVTSAFRQSVTSFSEQRESFQRSRAELENALKVARKLGENSALVLDGNALLDMLRKAKTMPCIMVNKDLSSEGTAFHWDKTNGAEMTATIQAFGSISGTVQHKFDFKTIDEAPAEIDEDDRLSTVSVGSASTHTSLEDKASLLTRPSSVDTGEDVIIESEEADGGSDISKSSKKSSEQTQLIITTPVVKGVPQKVMVTHIRSPNDFCVQLACNRKRLDTLSHNINTWCRRDGSVKHIPSVIQKNMLVLARYSVDKQWYRARVLNVETQSGEKGDDGIVQVHVLYIDFGNDERLPLKELRSMQTRFMKYPLFSVYCSLYDIAPHEEDESWGADAIQEFYRMTENQVFMLSALVKHETFYEVDLVYMPTADVLDDSYVSLRDILIFLELARFSPHSDGATKLVTPPSYPKVDFIKPTSVKNGKTVDVKVTFVDSPWNFYMACNAEEQTYYANMLEEMQQMYGKDACNIYSLFYPQAGMVCAAKGDDGVWYRAKVITPPVHKQVTVWLVDIGITFTMHYERLKKLHNNFIKLPAQAVHCRLADICPVGGPDVQWSDKTNIWCQNTMAGAVGQARFIRWDECSEVVLWLGSKATVLAVHSINYTLVELGLAKSTGLASVGAAQTSLASIGGAASGDSLGRQKLVSKPAGLPTVVIPPQCTSNSSSSSSTLTSPQKRSPFSSPSHSPVKELNNSPALSPRQSPQAGRQLSKSPLASSSSQSPQAGKQLSKSPITCSLKQSPQAGKQLSKSATKFSPQQSPQAGKNLNKSPIASSPKQSPQAGVKPKKNIASSAKRDLSSQLSQISKGKQSVEEKQKIQQEIHKAMCASGKDPSSNSDNPSMYIEVVISNYKSPSDFFIRIQEKEEELVQLMEDMQSYYGDSLPSPPRQWKVGEYCAAKYSGDGLWYRGNIKNILSAEEYEVEMVDYGYGEQINCSNMRPLKRELGTRLECAAVRCHLADMLPAGSADKRKWSRTATEFMTNTVKDKRLYIKQEGELRDSSLPIDIIVEEEIPETAFDPVIRTYHSLRQAILNQGLAMPSKKNSDPLSPDSATADPFQKIIFEENAERKEVEEEGGSKDSGTGSSFTASPNRQPEEMTREAVASTVPPYPVPDLESEMIVLPTFVDLHGVIFCQPLEWDGEIVHMSNELQRVYREQSHPMVSSAWKLNQLCVAFFPDDGQWYRAMIQELHCGEAKVLYIDFGNSATVTLSHLREMLPEFAEKHPLAYSCVLHDVTPHTQHRIWSCPVVEHIHELVVNNECHMIVKGVDQNYFVQVQLRNPNGIYLNEYLVANGWASSISDISDLYEKSRLVGPVITKLNPFNKLDVDSVDEIFQAILAHVELPNLIYLQRMRLPEPEGLDFVAASEVAEINNSITEFEVLLERLRSTTSMPMSKLPEVGLMCAAKYIYDGMWYRALCVKCYPEIDSCLLVFVDYGTTEVVPRSSIRLLLSEFWSLPAQAIRCYVNIIPPEEKWSREAYDTMVQELSDKELTVKVVQRFPMTVELLVGENGEKRLAYEKLIDSGLALQPVDDEAYILAAQMAVEDPDVIVEAEDEKDLSAFEEAQAVLEESPVKELQKDMDQLNLNRGGAAVPEEKNENDSDDDSSDPWTTDESEEEIDDKVDKSEPVNENDMNKETKENVEEEGVKGSHVANEEGGELVRESSVDGEDKVDEDSKNR